MKKPWLFRVYIEDYNTTQLCGDDFINHDTDPYETTGISWKVSEVFFRGSHVRKATVGQKIGFRLLGSVLHSGII